MLTKKVFNKYINLIFNINIEICCPYCFYKKSPCDHKIIEINDEKILQKDNISFEHSKNEYENYIKKTNILKEKIEIELEKIKNLEDKILNEMTISFKKQHENLTIKEKELKEDLIKNSTRIKNELKKFLVQSGEIIKENEEVGKYINYYEKNREKEIPIIIKTLSYISEIEKHNQKVYSFIHEFMSNMNISFNEESNSLVYNNYYFNGISTPINIKTKEENDYINMSWSINEFEEKIKDSKEYKFILEIKDDKDIFLYEGKETNINIYGLLRNKEYELKIRTFYKDASCNWSEPYKIKVNLFNNNVSLFGSNQNSINVYGKIINENKNINHNNCNPFAINNNKSNKESILWKKIN